jgi:hypothetical protein
MHIVSFVAGLSVAASAPSVSFAKAHAGLWIVRPARIRLQHGLVAASTTLQRPGLICLTLPLLTTIPNLPALATALFVLGAGVGSVGCVVNIRALIVERTSRRKTPDGALDSGVALMAYLQSSGAS